MIPLKYYFFIPVLLLVSILSYGCDETGHDDSYFTGEPQTNGLKEFLEQTSEGLIAYYPLNGNANDLSGNTLNAIKNSGSLDTNRFGQINSCYKFNGEDQYIEIPDNDALSISTTGELSISIWIRPDATDFSNSQGSGFIHWAGKGEVKQHEWTFRMYNESSDRPNRISGYVFNLEGGLGAGSFTEESIKVSKWIHIVITFNQEKDEIQLYKNGAFKDIDTFSGYNITAKNGTAPFRLGTRDLKSFFNGAIDDVRVYNRALKTREIRKLYKEPEN